MKKETLEEAAENFWLNDDDMSDNDRISYVNGFIIGAKWQQERSYSEEEVKNAFTQGFNARYKMLDGIESRDKFMEQFKKK